MKTHQSTQYNENALASLAATGDLDAFNQLVLVNQDLAYHHAYCLPGDPAEAQDASRRASSRLFKDCMAFEADLFERGCSRS